MNDVEQLAELKRRAADLAVRTSPRTANVLRLFPYLDVNDIQIIHDGREPVPERLTTLTELTGISTPDILYVTHQHIRLDFDDFTDHYSFLLARYQQSGLADEQFQSYLSDPAHGGRVFLLHGTLRVWDDFGGELSSLTIEPDSEDDLFPDAVEGYLISKGLAFPTSVDLLEASFRQQWSEWQSLWRFL